MTNTTCHAAPDDYQTTDGYLHACGRCGGDKRRPTTNTFGVCPAGGEFALTNLVTGDIISRHIDRPTAERYCIVANGGSVLISCQGHKCRASGFFLVPARRFPTLCTDCAEDAGRMAR